jgi:hypothetical protein
MKEHQDSMQDLIRIEIVLHPWNVVNGKDSLCHLFIVQTT